jgi:SAM-dependent methyltransferase
VAEFDRFRDTYERQIDELVRFSGQDREFFTRAKARAIVRFARERVGDPAELNALDVGCGVGLTVSELKGRFGLVAGVDVSAAMIERAREREPSIEYRVYGGTALPYEDNSFDLVYAICVLHHVPKSSRLRLVSELRRVVRGGGLVILGEHNPMNPLTRLVVSRCAFDVDAELLRAKEAERLLRDADLTAVERRYILIAPYESPTAARIERTLNSLPLGAQYVVAAAKPRIPE